MSSQITAATAASVLVIFTGDSIVAFGVAMVAVCAITLIGAAWWQAGSRRMQPV